MANWYGKVSNMNADEVLETMQWNNSRTEPFVLELNHMQFNALLVWAVTELEKQNNGEKYIYSPVGEIIEQIRIKRDASQHLG